MYAEPTSHANDSLAGKMANATGRSVKPLQDLSGISLDVPAFGEAVARDGARIVYGVNEMGPDRTSGDPIFGTTFVEPGRIGGEFHIMARGHIHATAHRPEVPCGEPGTGLMLMESPAGETRILALEPRVAVHEPPMRVHRPGNIGATPLVTSFSYPGDAVGISRSSPAPTGRRTGSWPPETAGQPSPIPTTAPARQKRSRGSTKPWTEEAPDGDF